MIRESTARRRDTERRRVPSMRSRRETSTSEWFLNLLDLWSPRIETCDVSSLTSSIAALSFQRKIALRREVSADCLWSFSSQFHYWFMPIISNSISKQSWTYMTVFKIVYVCKAFRFDPQKRGRWWNYFGWAHFPKLHKISTLSLSESLNSS